MAKKPRKRKPSRRTGENLSGNAVDRTVQDLVEGGSLPDADILERRFPGYHTSAAVRKEAILAMLAQLKFRNFKVSQIAASLGISVDMVYKHSQELSKRQEEEMMFMSVLGESGRSVSNYRLMQGELSKLIWDKKVKPTPKIMAITAAVDVENKIIQLYDRLGVYENIQYVPNLTSMGSGDAMKDLNAIGFFSENGDVNAAERFFEETGEGRRTKYRPEDVRVL